MGAFLSYSIISWLAMLAMYLGYKIFLARDKQHGFNRGVLLLIYAVSWASPLAAAWVEHHRYDSRPDIVQLPVVHSDVVVDMIVRQNTLAHQWLSSALVWIFIAGMAVVAVRTAVTWCRLLAVIHRGEKISREGYILVVTSDERLAPFRWMHYVVMGRSDYSDSCSAIAIHELKHVKSLHWIDLLVAQAVCIFNWFNPAAWLMRDELMLVHEYQADMAVIDSGADPQEYQLLLIKKAVGARFPSLANSLNHSKLKKRITMMYKEKSGAGRRMKALALVPVLVLVLGVAAMPPVRAAVSTLSSTSLSPRKSSEKSAESKTATPTFRIVGINNNHNKTTVHVEGKGAVTTLTVSGGTFTTCGKTYQATALSCANTKDDALIEVEFPFVTEFDQTSLSLNINGREVSLDLDGFLAQAHTLVVERKKETHGEAVQSVNYSEPKTDGVVVENNAASSNVEETDVDRYMKTSPKFRVLAPVMKGSMLSPLLLDTDLYLDGKKISESDLEGLSPSDIASVGVDLNAYEIRITTKSASSISGMRILLDGREIDQEEMNAYPADKIASMSVDKQTNTISIISK